jgi:hypothetical protein
MTKYKIVTDHVYCELRFDSMTEACLFAIKWLDGIREWNVIAVNSN